VNFDPSHDILSGNTDLRFLLNGWGERCKHIHLKDAAGIMQPGKFVFPMLGEGLADWNGFRAGLDDIGYDGTMSVEFESGCLGVYFANDLSAAARESMKAIRALGLDK
jgi:sugar phosphate isomerase/epimerase